MGRLLKYMRQAVWLAFCHGAFANAKAAAYSSILTFFPAFIVTAWVLEVTMLSSSFFREISYAIGMVLPPGARSTGLSYFEAHHQRSLKEIISASSVMLTAASGVMISWMDSFRKAYGMENTWGFWKERAVAFFLVFLTFAPMGFAMGLVAFGNQIESWLVLRSTRVLSTYIFLLWSSGRWLIAGITSVTVIMLIYHWALPRVQPWHRCLPGAMLATFLWFPVTLTFGWYVTRYATYNLIYGPLGAAIAMLVWLYILSIIIIVGAEFNALNFPRAVAEDKAREQAGAARQ